VKTFVRGDQIIDGTGGPPIPNGWVTIEDGRILSVGADGQRGRATDDVVIDLPGCTILPGLIDAHSHLASDPGLGNQPQQLAAPESELAMRSVRNMRTDLRAGVTTLRLMSEKHFIDVVARRLVDSGVIPGPRLVIATRGLRPSNGHGASPVIVDGADNIRRTVRENLRAGADLIKLFLTGGLSGTGADVMHCGYTLEEVRAAVDEAHGAGAPVAVHAHGGRAVDVSLEAGVDSIEHATMVTKAQIERIAAKGVSVVLTMTLFMHDDGIMRVDGANPIIRDRLLRARAVIGETARNLIRSGALIAVGTDALHGKLAHELEYLVQFGMSPTRAIACATRHGAEVCRIQDDTGTLEAGKCADLIAVGGDPTRDMAALHDVRLVVRQGLRCDALSAD
jgi:imidazolonepropionase-like amidohydrolase